MKNFEAAQDSFELAAYLADQGGASCCFDRLFVILCNFFFFGL